MGLSFVNNAGPLAGPAIAMRAEGDRSAFYHCSFIGNQVRGGGEEGWATVR